MIDPSPPIMQDFFIIPPHFKDIMLVEVDHNVEMKETINWRVRLT